MTDRAPAAPFHELVIATLKIKGITKAQLHQRSGVARSTIDLWRTQPRAPQSPTVLAVADALGIDRNEALRLAGILDDPTAVREAATPDLSELPTTAIVEEIHRLTDELHRRIPA